MYYFYNWQLLLTLLPSLLNFLPYTFFHDPNPLKEDGFGGGMVYDNRNKTISRQTTQKTFSVSCLMWGCVTLSKKYFYYTWKNSRITKPNLAQTAGVHKHMGGYRAGALRLRPTSPHPILAPHPNVAPDPWIQMFSFPFYFASWILTIVTLHIISIRPSYLHCL